MRWEFRFLSQDEGLKIGNGSTVVRQHQSNQEQRQGEERTAALRKAGVKLRRRGRGAETNWWNGYRRSGAIGFHAGVALPLIDRGFLGCSGNPGLNT